MLKPLVLIIQHKGLFRCRLPVDGALTMTYP